MIERVGKEAAEARQAFRGGDSLVYKANIWLLLFRINQ